VAYSAPAGNDVDFGLLSSYTAPAGNDVDFELGVTAQNFISALALLTHTESVLGGFQIDVNVSGVMQSTGSVSGNWDRSFYGVDLPIVSNDTVLGSYSIDVNTLQSEIVSTGSMHMSVTVPQIGLQLELAGMFGGFQIDVITRAGEVF